MGDADDGRRPDRPDHRRARRLDGDAPERRDRRGGRPLLLPADAGAEPGRLRAGNFPSVRYLYQAQRDLEVVVCEDDAAIVDAIDERTLLVPISHVLFRSGEIQDVERSCERAHEVGAHVILDAYQSAGIVPLDVTALDVDFAVGGSVKWLCGGPGNGWLYVRPDLADRLEPAYTGWQAHESPFAFEEEMRYAAGAARFLTGTPNVPALYAATAGYDLIEEIGVERIRAELAPPDRPPDRARRRGRLRGRSPRDPARRGGTVTVHVDDFPAVHSELAERQILCDFRPDAGIRIGPHYFTSDEELRHVIVQIGEIVAHRRARAAPRRRRPALGSAMTTALPSSLEIAQAARSARSRRSPRRRPRAGRGRALRPHKAKIDLSVLDRLARHGGRQARLRHGDHADEGGRGEDDDLGLADAGARPDRPEAGALPPRGVARAGVRDQGRRGGRRLRAGRPDGGPEPPLHRRHPRDRGGEQPARGDARGAHPARQRARHRPALDRLAALRRHQRPRPPQRRRRPRRARERLRPRVGLRHHGRLRGDGDRRRRPRPAATCASGWARSPSPTRSTASPCSPSSCGPRAR